MKLIASDFDGTLFRGGEISARDRAAIAAWRASGKLFGIVTGRGGELPDYAVNELGLALDFAVCGSGSMLYNGRPELYETHTTPGIYADMLEAEAKRMNAEGWGRCMVSGNGGNGGSESNGGDSFCQFSTRFARDAEAAEYVKRVNAAIPRINAFQNGRCVDVVGAGISKATGIACTARRFGVEEREIIAVGDSYNDLPMIRAYHGCAIRGSAIESAAPMVCADIAELCERYK